MKARGKLFLYRSVKIGLVKPKARPRGRPREFDQDQAIALATRAFLRRGYAGTSTEVLAEAMGVLKPSMYAAFGDKGQLFRASLAAWAEEVGARLSSAMTRAISPADLADRMLGEAVSVYAPTGRGAPWGCLVQSAAGDAVEALPEVGKWLLQFLEGCDRLVERSLEQLAPKWSASERSCFARALNAAIRDIAFRARARESRPRLEAVAASHAAMLRDFAADRA
jgi:TetR/AcrR family transcriptional regulator, copper-responsive repressor